MDLKQVPRIILRGDEEAASYRAREGIRQLGILKDLMNFQKLEQDVRRVRYTDGSEITCRSVFGIDDVQIYVPEIEEEEKEGKLGRFFAKVRKGGIYGEVKFYWITFTDEYEVSVSYAGSSRDLLNRMSSVPYTPVRNTHSFTKSFMIENEEEVEERWIAAPHLLIKETTEGEEKILTEVFNPLAYPFAQVSSLAGDDSRHYPAPPLFGSAVVHPCPPNRFYCNVDERKMVWYSCYSALDYTIPASPTLVHYCFGIILTLTDNMVSEEYYSPRGTEYQKIVDPDTEKELIKTFNCYSAEVDDEGFDRLWYYEKVDPDCTPPDPDPMCGADADIPYQMLTDINSLTEKTLEVFIPWGERPLKFTVDLTGSSIGTTENDHIYKEVTETSHWYWEDNGFEQRDFCKLDYTDQEGGVVNYSVNIVVDRAHSGCGPGDCSSGCGHPPSSGKFEETFSGQWQRIYWRQSAGAGTHHRVTFYYLYLPSETLSLKSWDWEVVTVQGKMGVGEICQKPLDECIGPNPIYPSSQIRYVGETLQQKLVNGFDAEWCSPNVVFVGAEKNRAYTDAFREYGNYEYSWFEGIQYTSDHYGLEDDAAAFATTIWDPAQEYIGLCGYPSADSYMNYVAPGVLWGSDVTAESFSRHNSMVDYGYGDPFVSVFCKGPWFWKLWGDENTLDEPFVLEYRIDGESSFSSVYYNRTYYLDDRSSYDSEGLMSAARGAIIVDYDYAGYPIFKVARWSVVYKSGDETFVDVTDKVLTALNCNKTELIELGLV